MNGEEWAVMLYFVLAFSKSIVVSDDFGVAFTKPAICLNVANRTVLRITF